MSPEEALRRVLDPQFPLEPTVKKAIRYLVDRLKEVEAQCPGNNSSTFSESTKAQSETTSPSPRPRARTAGSRSKRDRTES